MLVGTLVTGLLTALVGVTTLLAAAPAEASTYRYWTYWWGENSGKAHSGWQFASLGPAAQTLRDGSVVGWRFATTTTVGGAQPRQSWRYADLCGGTSPQDGVVRVALVIDYGTSSDAPPGEHPPTSTSVRRECLSLPASPTPRGVTALAKAGVDVRTDGNGLVCGLDGYPRSECAPVVADPSPTPTRTASPRPSATATAGSSARPAPSTSSAASSTRPGSASSSAAGSSTAPAATGSTGGAQPSGTSTGPAVGATADQSGSAVTTASGAPSPTGADENTLPAVAGPPTDDGSSGSQAGSSPMGAIGGVVLVALLAGGTWWTTRRRWSP